MKRNHDGSFTSARIKSASSVESLRRISRSVSRIFNVDSPVSLFASESGAVPGASAYRRIQQVGCVFSDTCRRFVEHFICRWRQRFERCLFLKLRFSDLLTIASLVE